MVSAEGTESEEYGRSVQPRWEVGCEKLATPTTVLDSAVRWWVCRQPLRVLGVRKLQPRGMSFLEVPQAGRGVGRPGKIMDRTSWKRQSALLFMGAR